MKVGVTGGAGFIGSWVADKLATSGHEVLIFDHLDRQSRFQRMLGNIRDRSAMMLFASQVEGIIHLAGILGTQETVAHPGDAVRTNVEGGLNFLAAIERNEIPGVNICVGNWFAQNPYSISKSTVERLCEMYRIEHGTKVNQVRCVNAYGPRQAAPRPYGTSPIRKIMPTFICQALSGRPVEVYGDGSQISDCVWVGDLAEALVRALEQAATLGPLDQVVEVGPAAHYSVGDVAEYVVDAADSSAGITHLPMRPGEHPAPVVADTSTLKLLGLEPDWLKPLDVGISETVDWFRSVEGRLWHRC